ncbi:MAG: iron ABC transporter permease [Candidatus Thermoplasmatota archaeon]|nr:iron ABC transporter permease [Candidatus Thermoplasmatota archaeon]
MEEPNEGRIKEVLKSKDARERYREHIRRKVLFITACTIALMLVFLLSLMIGPSDISLSQIFDPVVNHQAHTIIVHIRLPRALAAIVGGAGLSIAGVVMQSVLRNDLASPYTLGISHAASFGAALSIAILGPELYFTPVAAFVSSLAAVFVMIALAKYKGATAETMVLTGVALGSLYTGGLTAIKYFSTDEELAAITFWQFGDLSRASWQGIAIMFLCFLFILLFFILNSWNYNAMEYGDDVAKSLGVNAERIRISGMLFSSFITAVIVSFVGIIGFIGLVVPHIVRRVIGEDALYLLPASCIAGALLLLSADTASRTLFSPIILPVGILTSFLGAPLFIYLILTGRRR